MTPFTDLIRSPASTAAAADSLGARQRVIDSLFPGVVAATPLRLWRPDEPIPPAGRRLLVGVATWSAADMALLDELALCRHPSDLAIDVFNVADVRSAGEFHRYVPGLSEVFHTPVVGLWSDGHLVAKASGKAGRDLVAGACSREPSLT